MEPGALDTEIKNQLTLEQAWYYSIIPVKNDGHTLHCLVDQQRNTNELRTELEIILGRNVTLQSASPEHINSYLITNYPKSSNHGNLERTNDTYRLNVGDNNFLEALVKEAKDLNSSDIHIETYGEKCRIRFRVDGVLIDRHKLNRQEYPTIVNKIKIAAACDIAEKRLPQDGRIRFKFREKNLDIRVSVLPTLYGEKIVLRLLGSDAGNISIEGLGFGAQELERYEHAVKKPNGIILISGPTGSGKTTTLYATLKLINKPTNNILTIEDPVEYTLEGVNQVQLKEDIGLTYAEALRTFLRQDPDVIMLGEIRDATTAQMAIRAALTGHLVLSSIHTNSAWGTVSRLVDMGVPAYLLSTTLNLSVAQRLVRLLCADCKEPAATDFSQVPEKYRMTMSSGNPFRARGCSKCYYTGYKGRKAIYEVLNISGEVAELIKDNVTNIDTYHEQHKINKLADNAVILYTSGMTSIDEIYPYLISGN